MSVKLVSKIDLSSLKKEVANRILNKELSVLAPAVRGAIVARYYSGNSKKGVDGTGLDRRTGKAAKSWTFKVYRRQGQLGPKGTIVWYSTLKRSDFTTKKYITPTQGSYLAIPIASSLRRDGSKRYSSPEVLPFETDVIPIGKGKGFLVVRKREERYKGRVPESDLFFVLKQSVKVPAYTKGLPKFVHRTTKELMPTLSPSL